MNRVVVLGCGGAGKTYLSHQLADALKLPLTHLDAIYYDAEWKALDAATFSAKQKTLVDGDRWLIEGNYASSLPIRLGRADTVIFLDVHPVVCLLGIVERRLRYGRGQHDWEGVYNRITPGFVRYICGYRRRMRPKVLSLLEANDSRTALIVLQSRSEVSRFLQDIGSVAITNQ